MDLVLYPDDPLTQRAEPFAEITPDLRQLADDMIDTMFAYEGVGLAGPQVGVARRIFVLCEPEGEPMCFINPELSDLEGEQIGEEGCLSMPKLYAQVPRAQRLRIRALDPTGRPIDLRAEGFLARIIQHEFDHLEGMLFPDRLDLLTREDLYRQWAALRQELAAAGGNR
jgi:peptide deformylase